MSKSVEPRRWGANLQPNLFAQGRVGRRGVVMPRWTGDDVDASLPGAYLRDEPCDLPSLSEPEVMRHYTRLSNLNHHIERGMYPLGSCTMKHNPRMNEKVAAMSGFADLHPEQDVRDVQGLLCALKLLEDSLCRITGFDACSLVPAAGAHGEFLGMYVIRALHLANGEPERVEVLIPDSAHGTNPASVVLTGMTPRTIPSGDDGRLDPEAVREAVGPQTAGIMITNPNTLGLFEENIVEVAEIVHAAGGRLYMDGANMNAILGKAHPALMGFDVIHFNLHKTFGTPHGGGGPGAGPICVTKELESFLPGPRVVVHDGVYDLDAAGDRPSIHSYQGNTGVCLRALAYILRLGADGLERVAERAVLNANYLLAKLRGSGVLKVEHAEGCLHEFIATGSDWKDEHGVRTLDVAKRLLDYGVHAPTIYFPLIVEEAMMIEPTETESKETLDEFVEILTAIREEARTNPDLLHEAPVHTPVSRLDEAKAARQPDLSWMGPCGC